MPTNINYLSDFPPLVNFDGAGDFAPNGAAKKQIRLTTGGAGNAVFGGGLLLKGSFVIAGAGDFSAFGRLNAETNVFGAFSFAGAGAFSFSGRVRRRGVVVFAGSSQVDFIPPAAAETFPVRVLIQIAPPNALANRNHLSARLTADGADVPIIGYNFSKPETAAGFFVSFDLARFSDRAAIETASEFSFDLYAGGAWFPVFAFGEKQKSAFSLGFADAAAANSLSISTIPETTRRLTLFPARETVFYDSLRETIAPGEIKTLYSNTGEAYAPETLPVAGLTLYDLFQKVFVLRCGFSSVQTDISNFPIRRADFAFGETYLDGINRHVALFKPLIYTTNGGATLWIVKGTQQPGGAGVVLSAGEYDSLQLEKPFDIPAGAVLTYAEQSLFDYSTIRNEPAETTETGTFGNADFVRTTIFRVFRDFYRVSNPFVPVRSEKISEIRETRAKHPETGLLTLIDRETETATLDSFQRLSRILIEKTALVPNLATGGEHFVLVRRDETAFSYAADKYAPKRKILKRTARTVSALVAINTENQYLGKDFKQDFLTAHRDGNLIENMETEFSPVFSEIETNFQRSREQIETTTEKIDFLRGAKTASRRAARNGDISANAQTGEPVQVYIKNPNGAAAKSAPVSLSAGEIPATIAAAQTENFLRQTAARRGSVRVFGGGAAFDVGTRIELKDQTGANIGAFLVTGFSATGANLGTPKQATRRTLNLIEIL